MEGSVNTQWKPKSYLSLIGTRALLVHPLTCWIRVSVGLFIAELGHTVVILTLKSQCGIVDRVSGNGGLFTLDISHPLKVLFRSAYNHNQLDGTLKKQQFPPQLFDCINSSFGGDHLECEPHFLHMLGQGFPTLGPPMFFG